MIMKDDLGYRNYVPEHVNKEAMASLTKVRPPLEQALSDIDERLSVLWEHIAALEVQVEPVLKYAEPSKNESAGSPIDSGGSSPLINSLRGHRHRLDKMIESVSELRSRVLL